MYSRDSGIPLSLYAYAGGVLARAAHGRETNMTRGDAERLLRSLTDAHGVSAGRLFDGKEAFFDEEEEGVEGTDSGGGALEYREDARSLLLARTYESAPEPEEFVEDVRILAEASLVWARDAVPRVASRMKN